jgi:hypothetical protein
VKQLHIEDLRQLIGPPDGDPLKPLPMNGAEKYKVKSGKAGKRKEGRIAEPIQEPPSGGVESAKWRAGKRGNEQM